MGRAADNDGLRMLKRLDLGHFREMEALERACYSEEYITPAEEAYAWYLAAPNTTIALVDEGGSEPDEGGEGTNGPIVGFVNLFPVSERVYRGLRAGTFNDRDLTVADVVTLPRPTQGHATPGSAPDTPGPLHMFLSCILVDSAHRGGAVTRRLLQEAVARYAPIEHLVDEVVTDNVTPEGVRFSQRWGFEPVCVSNHGSQVFAQPYAAFARRVRGARPRPSVPRTAD